MSTVVHFEVYMYDEVRGWELQGQFPSDARLRALEEAKMLEFSLNKPVRVLRETYYPGSNKSEEIVTYIGRLKPKPRAQATLRRGVGRVDAHVGGAPFSERDIAEVYSGAPRRPSTTVDFAFRLIVVMIASLAVAVVGTGILSMIGGRLLNQMGIAASSQSLLMFLVFMGLFLLTAVPLVMLYVPLETLFRDAEGPVKRTSAVKPPQSQPPVAPELNDTPEKQIEAAVAAQAEDDSVPTAPPVGAEPSRDDIESEQAKRAAEQEAAEAAEAAAMAEAARKAKEQQADEDDEGGSVALEQCRLIMMKFLGGAVSAIKTVRPQLDAYNRFGINLYLAGACTALAEARELSAKERRVLIQEAVEVVGTRAEHANQLIDRLEVYKTQSRYRQMIAAGKVAMEVHLSGSSDPFIALGGVVKDWNTPQSQQIAASSAITILFTDMVGSTDLTQTIGDAAAQNIIRAHNHIVRGALATHRGKEVKHTGDGIMASFDQPVDAVAAAVEIQQKAADHTSRWPTEPLLLRVGMNTGEPIIEENDYFGATVQIAARVCACAGPGQVWLSEDTYASLAGTAELDIHDHGRQQLKGVQEDIGLYEVVWDEKRREQIVELQPDPGALAAEGPEEETDTDRATVARQESGTTQTRIAAERETPVIPVDTPSSAPAPKPSAPRPGTENADPAAPRKPRPKPNLERMPPAPPPRKSAGSAAPPRKPRTPT